VSDIVVDASLALQWCLDDESGRKYSLDVLTSLAEKRAVVPILWFYEVGNGLIMAHRRKRITLDQVNGFLLRLKALPIVATQLSPADILELPALAQKHGLTNYDAAYLAVAIRLDLPLATTDNSLRNAAAAAGVGTVAARELR
jgi:predicted nucleic acid-binding protein